MTSPSLTTRPATEDRPLEPLDAAVRDADAVKAAQEAQLRAIARDCREQPQRYLDEVVVPFGGE
jgi:hypothetical protein